ncbi:DUF4389 domain-containing protein [Nocardia sp. ET3-3]|uniref:DUF4389 domain-containing protein n=1 Tax=Nocardia terrae TaxID=2675851 RepID=A0A7K1UQ73_9NOCA|nr:DUF4389 domain-containing protein [Nocardia terrae]MVU76048.1 DUF4389 domain-containing protein [Nocardia terrae]
MQPSPVYPVRVRGDLDPGLSRWMWIVKWILAIPHYIVLIFLSIAYLVVSIIAFFAILFTESYPRQLFDFNVGVMRWSWRVRFYALTQLGTDRYPPFSLAPDPDYPADLEVDYPERLNRWLVLIKWWLLAIPQYLILSAFFGNNRNMGALVAILVIIAMVGLLFTAVYPAGLYDLLMGINRWSFRVRAYASLMTDAYPPFRLDQGAREPDAAAS